MLIGPERNYIISIKYGALKFKIVDEERRGLIQTIKKWESKAINLSNQN